MTTGDWANELGQMPLVETQATLPRLPERLAEGNRPLALTRSGAPVLAVLTWDLFESLLETLEIMNDPVLMAALRRDMSRTREPTLAPVEQLLAQWNEGEPSAGSE